VKALVTGGAGFIGHHLVRALLARGDEVAVIDDYRTGSKARLVPVLDRIQLVEGDIRDAGAIDAAMAGVEVVYHEAALPSVARSMADPRLTTDINVNGTVEVMLGAARAAVRRVVLAGSSSVYGSRETLPRREDQPPDPRSPYATSKLAAELLVHQLGAYHGVESVVLRYFNVFGPGQDPDSEYAAVVPRFITTALRGERPTIHGDGQQSRDFTYIDNVVLANLRAAEASGASGITANIGAGGRYTLLELLAAIGARLGRDIEPVFAEARPGDVRHSQADVDLARRCLGYEVVVPFEEGIGRTVEWFEAGGLDLTAS
jgi:UDP-glucose 4-epimerase